MVFHVLLHLLWLIAAIASSIAKPGCQDQCGNVTIHYPFGIGDPHCFIQGFNITCNQSFNPPKPFIHTGNAEVLDISLQGQLLIRGRMASGCHSSIPNVLNQTTLSISFVGTPYTFSDTRNKFTAIGCDTFALIRSNSENIGGCASVCSNKESIINGSCSGIGCCQTSIPMGIKEFGVSVNGINFHNETRNFSPCSYAFLVDEDYFTFTPSLVSLQDFFETNIPSLPILLDWAIGNKPCQKAHRNSTTYACLDQHNNCTTSTNGPGYRCYCNRGYDGNPYHTNGCQDVNECAFNPNPCYKGNCHNTEGSYYCSCPSDTHGNYRTDGEGCIPNPTKGFPAIQVVLGVSLGLLFLLVSTSWIYWGLRKRKLIKLKHKFFRQNGGLLLQEQICFHENITKTAKIFTEDELRWATDNYAQSRIIGRGGYGTVYKGILSDHRIVAIKKSKVANGIQIEQFINEISILLQIKHRNVVKLLGCCLETEVPLLVYEFISNGTLFHHVHDESRKFSISWENRLRIAAEAAGALAYLHSASSYPIIHRDVKSSNILLDENYLTKVSDFGTSKLVPLDYTQITTLVQGTLGYLDPEYFQTSQLTKKSDVYSFGVVLLELLTGEKAFSQDRPENERNLAMYFISSLNENRLFQILENRIVDEGEIEKLYAVANLAHRCLTLKGEDRPTMKDVVAELDGLRKFEVHSRVEENHEETRIMFASEPSRRYDSLHGAEEDKPGSTLDESGIRVSRYLAEDETVFKNAYVTQNAAEENPCRLCANAAKNVVDAFAAVITQESQMSLLTLGQNVECGCGATRDAAKKEKGKKRRDMVFHVLLHLLWLTAALASSIAKPGCQDQCGNVTIPYPFGIGDPHCFIQGFNITCNQSFNPPKPFIHTGNAEVLDISLQGQVLIGGRMASDCHSSIPNMLNQTTLSISFVGTPYTFSDTRNKFTAIGCDTFALIGSNSENIGGCASICSNKESIINGSCFGIGCCQTSIPMGIKEFGVSVNGLNFHIQNRNFSPCSYAFLVDEDYFTFNSSLVSRQDFSETNIPSLPIVLDWGIGSKPCHKAHRSSTTYACIDQHSNCTTSTNGPGYRCYCNHGYDGNPYLTNGCQDVNECVINPNPCNKGKCHNTEGSYYCSCPNDTHGNYGIDGEGCIPNPSTGFLAIQAFLGITLGHLSLRVGTSWMYRLRKRKLIKLKQKFFRQNGGLLLQEQISFHENITKTAKIFTEEELRRATDNYAQSRIIGRGGYGTVYKGILSDHRIVAIKKSKVANGIQIDQFINEISILLQIKHRNVVKLFGCCLETEIPLLVYEFVSNGTLFHHVHDESRKSSISWENRLRIAAEAAGALAYLHSASSFPIIHRDVKSSNILLDENYSTKVSDFGTSKLVPLDYTQITTLVQGTLGYLDPEYFQTSQLTEKSDVYSFGVVLLELLTGEKAFSQDRPENERNLAMYFISSMNENRLFQILENRIVDEGVIEKLYAVANLARRCLTLKGEDRPTMKDVVAELNGLRKLEVHSRVEENHEEIQCMFASEPSRRYGSLHGAEEDSLLFHDILELDETVNVV
ncbi:uncharacterized protein LOC143864935 [Tasmannia lanceolata]|uniref:uncharacterized protein LOC143864935 n=1 Tax=Tasmannia lanceolata TaxID=3420 RepID=UPI004062DBD9